MEFSRVGEHTIKCVISEDEIYDLGYTMDEIMSNGERTQEFMNQIFDMAEQEFGTKFDMGIKTVRADFMSDHTLSLTFSEHPATEGMMEHLKDIVNGLMNSIPPEAIEKAKNRAESAKTKKSELETAVIIEFGQFDVAVRFARMMKGLPIPESEFYKFEGAYYLQMDLSGYDKDNLKRLSILADEYADDIFAGAKHRAFMLEHAKTIIKENAIECLASL